MSGEDNSTNNTPDMMTDILEAINNVKNELNSSINNNNNNMQEKFNSLTNELNSNNQAIREKLESVQAENAATREELLARIDTRSRASTRAPSRATSPRQLAARLEELNMKMPELIPVTKMPDQTKHIKVPDLYEDNRPGNPVMKETFTRTTPDNKARLSSPLTLEKCLVFERDMLDFQQKYNVEVRYTNYVDNDLKYEIRARFELTDSNFYELSQQELHRCLSEMIVPKHAQEGCALLIAAWLYPHRAERRGIPEPAPRVHRVPLTAS